MTEKKIWYQKIKSENENNIKKYINYNELIKKKKIKILDFGCGNGRYMFLFKKIFPNSTIYGVDINSENIAKLKKDFKNVFLLNSKKINLNFKENTFDLIFSSNVIEHIPRKLYLQYLKRIKLIMKKESKFVFGTPNYPYKRIYDLEKAFYYLLKKDFKFFKYYLFDDPTHINKLNYKLLENDFKIFKKVDLYPTKIAFNKIIKNKKYSDKIMGIAYK